MVKRNNNNESNNDINKKNKYNNIDGILKEDNIPDTFNEKENDSDVDGVILRTLIDFELIDENGDFVSFDKLGSDNNKNDDDNKSNLNNNSNDDDNDNDDDDNNNDDSDVQKSKRSRGNKIYARGKILYPMNEEIRTSIMNILCTVPQQPPSHEEILARVSSYSLNSKKSNLKKSSNDMDTSMDTTNMDELKSDRKSLDTKIDISKLAEPIEILDREKLQVGDYIDAYCDKTHKWHEAKVLSIKDKPGEGKVVKIHFQGWNSKHDEIIALYSDRLAHVGTGLKILYDTALKASQMIPWFEAEQLKKTINQQYGSWLKLGKESTIAVEFEVSDYCIDYTYANPTLWVISSLGYWYRVAGPLTPEGYKGSPKASYKIYFEPIIEKYFISAHVVMVLLDYLNLPGNTRLGLQAVFEEMALRSSNTITLNDILKHYSFIYEQISALEQPADWQRAVNFKTCHFAKQLVTQGSLYVDRESKKNGLPVIKKKKEEIALVKMVEKEEEDDGAAKLKTLPHISTGINKLRTPSHLHSQLFFVWSTLTNFSSLLGIPLIGLEFLEDMLTMSDPSMKTIDSNNDDDTIPIHDNVMIREIHASLLQKILVDRIKFKSLLKFNISNENNDSYYDDDKVNFNSSTTVASIIGLFWKKMDLVDIDLIENRVANFVRIGNTITITITILILLILLLLVHYYCLLYTSDAADE